MNQAKPRPCDRIRVSWQFENEGLLVNQSVHFFTPFLLGFQQPQDSDLNNGVRNIEFDFTRPVTVILRGAYVDLDTIEFTVPLRPDTDLGGQIVLNGPGVQAVIAGP